MATLRRNFMGSFGVPCLMIGQSVTWHLQLAGYSDDNSGSSLVGNSTSSSNGTGACDRSCCAITVALSLSFLVSLYQVQMFTVVLFPLCPFPARNFSDLKNSASVLVQTYKS